MLLGDADWVKLNEEELSQIAKVECRTAEEVRKAVHKLRSRHGGRRYFITSGAAGAYAVDKHGELLFAGAPKPETMVDTVGAGDAFAAAIIIGVGLDRPMDEVLDFAVRFASQTCTIQGATATDRSHYTEFTL